MKLLNRIRPVQLSIIIALVYLIGFFGHALYLHKTVYGDGVYYYSWLRSVIVDHDIRFADEFNRLGGGQPVTPLGLAGNKYSVGPAILWAPAFIFVHEALHGDGYGLPYQLATGLVSVLSALFALLLLWRLLNRYFDSTVSIMAIAAVAGASNLLFYGSIDTVNSHALTFFAATVFLTLILDRKKHWFAAGVFLGLLGLIRTQDFLYGILLIPLITRKNILLIFAGVLLAFSPQLVAWQYLYGKFWISPYISGGEGFNFLRPQILGVLFYPKNGLFLWTPVTLFGVVGFFTGQTKRIPLRLWMLAVIGLELYFVSSWSTWWQGASYSGRMFVSALPILAFGVASIFSWLEKMRFTQAYFLLTIVGPLSLINANSIIYFLLSLPHQ